MQKRIFAAWVVFGFLLSNISGCGHKADQAGSFVITDIEVVSESKQQDDVELSQDRSAETETETAETETSELKKELEEQEVDIVSKNSEQENDMTETECLTDLEENAGTLIETENQPETKKEADIQKKETFSPEKQFQTCAKNWPEASKVGMIYSAGNKKAQKQLKKVRELAEEYGMELIAVELQEKIDIDLETSELVGQADVIFCLDDEAVNELIPTICAYAKEVKIPVLSMEGNVISKENSK